MEAQGQGPSQNSDIGGGRSLSVDKNYTVPLLDLDVGLKIVEFDVGLKNYNHH